LLLMGFQRSGQATYLNIGVYLLNTSLLYQNQEWRIHGRMET
jgi:hypothetical protein